MAILKKASTFVIVQLERFFFWWGCFVARQPFIVIFGSLLIASLACIGFINLSSESRAEKLWIPQDSPYIGNKAWLEKNFPKNIRTQLALFSSKVNILEPKALISMLDLREKILAIDANNKTFEDICYRVPIADIFLSRRRRGAITETSKMPRLNTPKMIKIGAVLNVITSAAPTATSTTTGSTETASTTPTSVKKSSELTLITTTPQTTERRPKVISDSFGTFEESPAKPFNSYDYGNKKLGGADSIWSSDYADYEEYEFDSQTLTSEGSSSPESANKEISHDLPPEIYCDLVNTLNDKCLESSILELWRFDRNIIEKLTKEDIIDAINNVDESPYFGYKFNYAELLGDIERNATGHIVGAKSALNIWTTSVDPKRELRDETGAGLELDLADEISLEWEKAVADTMLQHSTNEIQVLANVARSFSDISTQAIFFDGVKMVSGWFLMFLYTMVMLGRFNLVEHRTYLSAAGFVSVGMGLVISLGITFLIGMPYTPMHAILPFLYLGIGIDDMFVIIQCWYNLVGKEDFESRSLPEKIGLTLQHAGVAITVTSLTDVFAFGIGAVTILPGLQAFCVTCAIGIGSIYLLQASWFVAWMSLDQKRIEARRDGLLPCCITHKNWTPSSCSQREMGKSIMSIFAKFLASHLYKVFIILTTLAFLSIGAWGSLQIRQEFDPVLLLPAESYLRQWIDLHEEQWPQNGWVADIFVGKLNPDKDLEPLDKLILDLQNLSEQNKILKGVDSWWIQFKSFLSEEKNMSDWRQMANLGQTKERNDFSMLLSDFLFSRSGSKYKNNFFFDGELVCNEPAPNITASQFTITYLPFEGPEEHIPGRKTIEKLIKDLHFSGKAFSFSKVYAAWETDEVIAFELWRNLGLGILCVFVITIILLADLKICFFVLSCVFLTLVDIVGFLHFWGITIDTLSCINIVLAIGLCVDYSAHVAHAFIVGQGSKLERAQESLTSMGPAIVNGGLTTFLALLLLGFSTSHVFITFFKVFLLTVIFGLFHGLIFLPVILSIFGTEKNDDGAKKYTTDEEINANDPRHSAGHKSAGNGNGITNAAFVNDSKEQSGKQYLQEMWSTWLPKIKTIPVRPRATEAGSDLA